MAFGQIMLFMTTFIPGVQEDALHEPDGRNGKSRNGDGNESDGRNGYGWTLHGHDGWWLGQ